MGKSKWWVIPVAAIAAVAASAVVAAAIQSAAHTDGSDHGQVVPAVARDAEAAPIVPSPAPTARTAPTATATIPPAPTGPPEASYERALRGLEFPDLVLELMPVPGSGSMVAVVRSGLILTFPAAGPFTAPSTALDTTGRVDTNIEAGLLSMAFDPNFGSNGFVYL